MAITVKSSFASFAPGFNPLEVCLDSTNKALANFQYIIDVYIEGVAGYERFLVDPEPVLTYGAEDIGRYIESYLYPTPGTYNSTNAISLGTNAVAGTSSIKKVTLKYGESYGTPVVAYPDLVTSSDFYIFGGCLDYNDWLDWTANNYLCNITNGANAQFLTDKKTNKVSLNNLGWHHILTDTPTDIDSLAVITYDADDNIIQTVVKANGVAQNLTVSRNYRVATAPETLNNMTGAFISGAQPVITSDVARYEVKLVDTGGNIASETLYFEMEEPCRYPQVRLHFLNRFYSFDCFNFNLRNRRKRTNKKEGYKMDKYPIVTAGISRNHADQSQVISYIEVVETITLRSDYLTDEENEWLLQLIESPDIYMEFTDAAGNVNLKAVRQVTNNSWTEQTNDADKLFILEIEIELSHKSYRQRR